MATLEELEDRLRFRISEIDPGLWSSEEIKMVLNMSQVEVAKDCQQRGREWSAKMQYRIPVEDGREYVVFPEDFMFEESLVHYFPGYSPRTLYKENVQNILFNAWNANNRYETRYKYYEVRGRTAGYIRIGTAEEGSNAERLVDENLMVSGIRVGDLVHNINDGGYAPILGWGSGYITLGDWIGGVSGRFYLGESYRIQRPERTRYQCFLWPLVRAESPVVYEGIPVGFSLDKDVLVKQIDFRVSVVPDDWEEDDVVRVSTYQDGTLLPDLRWGQQQVRLGYNTLTTLIPFQMDQMSVRGGIDSSYEFVFAGGVTVDRIRIESETDNYLLLNYIALPRPMVNSQSICEFPDEYLEPLLDYAKLLAYDKKDPSGQFRTLHLNQYYESRDRTRQYKTVAAPSPGNASIMGRRYFRENNQGFTSFYGNVEF